MSHGPSKGDDDLVAIDIPGPLQDPLGGTFWGRTEGHAGGTHLLLEVVVVLLFLLLEVVVVLLFLHQMVVPPLVFH